jgi:hypothetical protein
VGWSEGTFGEECGEIAVVCRGWNVRWMARRWIVGGNRGRGEVPYDCDWFVFAVGFIGFGNRTIVLSGSRTIGLLVFRDGFSLVMMSGVQGRLALAGPRSIELASVVGVVWIVCRDA